MGNPNLEVFKFGLYILFPIGYMWYFGTNLEERFSVPDFWPKEHQTHKIPFEKDEIQSELARMKARRLALRENRLAGEGQSDEAKKAHEDYEKAVADFQRLRQSQAAEAQQSQSGSGWFGGAWPKKD
ncbi:uncharacterized protein J3D65DRAFT_620355 [Phyllosticta citribraziliensis]|uniref:Mitochondrial cytochrome c oxidase assembly factor n=1 Tax=Phyllosticta citribraziliensis TaxID=989973 RepID=A0ABR1LZ01_9PEZI